MTTKLVQHCKRMGQIASHQRSALALHLLSLSLVAGGLGLVILCGNGAQAQINIPQAAATTCAVMSGQRKPDRQAIQYLLLLDEDVGEGNPVALAFCREVIKQCPKAYLNYQQHKKISNPFPPGSLVKSNPTQLSNPGSSLTNQSTSPDFPLRCKGAPGMALANGKNLIVEFKKGDRPADQALEPSQCSWLDRGLRPSEPTHIVDECPSNDEARKTAEHINAGDTWTFWVVNAGTFFRATASTKGVPNQKPIHLN
jgi:hypothetical protein